MTGQDETDGTWLSSLTVVNRLDRAQEVRIAVTDGDEISYRSTRTIGADTGRELADVPAGPFPREQVVVALTEQPDTETTFQFADRSTDCVELSVDIVESETTDMADLVLYHSFDCRYTGTDTSGKRARKTE